MLNSFPRKLLLFILTFNLTLATARTMDENIGGTAEDGVDGGGHNHLRSFQFKKLKNCKTHEMYDFNQFNCVPCEKTSTGSSKSRKYLLESTNDRTECQCVLGTETFVIYDSSKERPFCANRTAKASTTTSKVGVNCTNCSIPAIPRIKCKLKFVISMKLESLNGNLLSSLNRGTYSIPSLTLSSSVQIVVLHYHHNNNNSAADVPNQNRGYDDNCLCDLKMNQIYHDYCIRNNLIKQDFLQMQKFRPFLKEEIYGNLPFITFFCRVLRNATACNHLANLCITSFYSYEKHSPCSLFLLIQTSELTASFFSSNDDTLKDIQPILFLRKGKRILHNLMEPIDFSYGLTKNENEIQLFMTIYSLDGHLKYMGKINYQKINLCHIYTILKEDKIEFTRSFEEKCEFSLRNVIDVAREYGNKYFINLYVNYTIQKVIYLRAVPILIRNIFTNEQDNKPEHWQLVRRFQLIHIEELNTNNKINRRNIYNENEEYFEDNLNLIHFPESFQINFKIEDRNRITTPLIRIKYRTIEFQKNSSEIKRILTRNEFLSYKFEVKFSKEFTLNFYYEILLPLLLLFALVFALLRMYSYKNRQNKEFYDFEIFMQFILYLISYSGNVLYVIATGLCFYVLFMHFNHKVVKLLLPIKEQYLLNILIHVAVLFKGIYITYRFWKISNINIFFMDWERPRGSYENHNMLLSCRGNFETNSICSSARSIANENCVSAWRIIFIANKWLELSAKRKISIFVHYLIFLVVYKMIEDKCKDKISNELINLSIVVFLYSSIYAIEYFSNQFLWQKINGNPLQKFVDICSIANISIFILLQDSYGFYIHGRSPHGFSDTDMSSIILQLQRETYTISRKRGLLTGSDHQTYIILAPTDLKIYYNKLLAPFLKTSINMSQTHFEKELASHGGTKSKHYETTMDKIAQTYNGINRFFCAFIDHAIKDLDYIVKDRTFIENLLDCEFENFLTENKGTFYIDESISFGKSLLYGNELELFLFELYIFTSLFILTSSAIMAASIICILTYVVKNVIHQKMKNNIARKTLIDRRFL